MNGAGLATSWRTALGLTLGVAATLLMGFLLALGDVGQLRLTGSPDGSPAGVEANETPRSLIALLLAATPLPVLAGPFLPSPTPPCTPPAGWALYVVQPGDTLAGLAAQAGLTVAELQAANCLAGGPLLLGQPLFLPVAAVVCGPPADWVLVQIHPGDTLSGLAARYGTTVEAIMLANCLVSQTLTAGNRLYLPGGVLLLPPTRPRPTATRPVFPTPTRRPTLTPSPTASTATPALTASPTLTATATSTATLALTPSPTATATPPLTATVPVSVTATVTATPVASVTPTATPPGPSETPTPPAPTPVDTPSPTSTPPATSTPPPTPTATAVPPSPTPPPSTPPSSTPPPSPTPVPPPPPTPTEAVP